MNKRIISLIMIIPFAIIVMLFSVGKVISIRADIAVSGIRIVNKPEGGNMVMDIAGEADFLLEVEILPMEAKNKGFIVKQENADAVSAKADFAFDEPSQRLTALSTGKTKIVVESKDGAFRDSMVIDVHTSKILDFGISLFNAESEELSLSASTQYDYEIELATGRYFLDAVCVPQINNAEIRWSSADFRFVSVDEYTGICDVKFSGNTVVTATADGAKGEITKTILLKATQAQSQSGITVNGNAQGVLLINKDTAAAQCSIEISNPAAVPVISGIGAEYVVSAEFAPVFMTAGLLRQTAVSRFLLNLTFAAVHPDEISLIIENGEESTELRITFGDFSFDLYRASRFIYADGDICQFIGQTIKYSLVRYGESEGISFEWASSDFSVLSVSGGENGVCQITALKSGAAEIEIRAKKNGVYYDCVARFTLTVAEHIVSLGFDLSAFSVGLGQMRFFGDTEINSSGNYVASRNVFAVSAKNLQNQEVGFVASHYNAWSSDGSTATAYVADGGILLNIHKNGSVVLYIEWVLSDTYKVSASVELGCVKDGVNVSGYTHLKKATQDGRQVVLGSNIMLGKANASAAELQSYVSSMLVSYPWDYYTNLGLSRPEVKYCIEFTNNVFGNGYYINAEYITKAKDAQGNPIIFKGPQNFADIDGAISLKSQDNTAFLIRTDDVLLYDVQLMGCSDNAIASGSGIDLGLLHYAGTVLELMSNASIINCRIKNGRNVVRAYGGRISDDAQTAYVSDVSEVNAADERIVVSIEGSILSQAREYIVKVGSSRILRATQQDVSPSFEINGVVYDVGSNLDELYDYIVLTDLTLRDCVLSKSGLFSVGIETSYAGDALAGVFEGPIEGWDKLMSAWSNLGGTSFPCLVRFEGDVRIYDWKELDLLESGTLLELALESGSSYLDEFLKLDLKNIFRKVSELFPEDYENTLIVEDGVEYIHTGVFFLGGGKNYSQVDFSALNGGTEFEQYSMNLSMLTIDENGGNLYEQGLYLPCLIGTGDFEFLIYTSNSSNTMQGQAEEIENGTAYSWIQPVSLF